MIIHSTGFVGEKLFIAFKKRALMVGPSTVCNEASYQSSLIAG
jgi:hypothetical protein